MAALRGDSTKKEIPAIVGVNTAGGIGVSGISENYRGVEGVSVKHPGVVGVSTHGRGVEGWSTDDFGVVGVSTKGPGVVGISDNHTGVGGESKNGIGVRARGGRLAGLFEGDVEVTGDIRLINADCAEDFNIGTNASVEPGTVMVLGEEDALFPSQHAYDKRVAGVVSGAGNYKPGIVLDKQQSGRNRQPIALLGKVYCKVNAQYGAIEVGDLLTTSPAPGHAMKVDDPAKAVGAIIGKALRPLKEGQGLIPILIALQ